MDTVLESSVQTVHCSAKSHSVSLAPSLQEAPISGCFRYQNISTNLRTWMIYIFVMHTIKSLLEYSGTKIDQSS